MAASFAQVATLKWMRTRTDGFFMGLDGKESDFKHQTMEYKNQQLELNHRKWELNNQTLI